MKTIFFSLALVLCLSTIGHTRYAAQVTVIGRPQIELENLMYRALATSNCFFCHQSMVWYPGRLGIK